MQRSPSAEEVEPLARRPNRHELLQDLDIGRRGLGVELVQRLKRRELVGLVPATPRATLLARADEVGELLT